MNPSLSQTLQFLEALEAALPPPEGHHSITLGDYGNDQDGWCEYLVLGVREDTPAGVRQLLIFPPDFEKSQEELIGEIVQIMQSPAEPAGVSDARVP